MSFDEYEQEAKTLTHNHAYVADRQHRRKRKAFFDEDVDGSDEEQFSGRQKFIIETFYVLADCLLTELEKRNKVYRDVSN